MTTKHVQVRLVKGWGYRYCLSAGKPFRNWIIWAIRLLLVLLLLVVAMKLDSRKPWWSRRRVIGNFKIPTQP
jgi:hypothetical protein